MSRKDRKPASKSVPEAPEPEEVTPEPVVEEVIEEVEADEDEEVVFSTPDGPEKVEVAGAEPVVGLVTTYHNEAPPAPEPEAAPKVPREGTPRQYMILRTANKGWVIEERWQNLESFDAIQAVIDAEVAAGRNGTLFRGNHVIAVWGDGVPARI